MRKIKITFLRVCNDTKNFASAFWIQIDALFPKKQIKSKIGIPKHQSTFNVLQV